MQKSFREAFGLNFDIKELSAPKGLPFYMSNNRIFYEARSSNIIFIIVELLDIDRFGVVALEKQMAKYVEATGLNVAYAFPILSKTQRDALTNRNMPFICMPNQIYLPFLGVILSDQFKKEKIISTERMTPAAQSLFLYFLYTAKGDAVLKKEAADSLELTRTSITRASEQLKAMGLLYEERNGKEVRMTASATGKMYFEQAKQYLINPIYQVITIKGNDEIRKLPLSGESALSNRSMLNSPQRPIVAVSKINSMIKNIVAIDEKWEYQGEVYQLEIWKYNPLLFAVDNMVDPVSMLMCLQDCMDERVQGELEDYMEELKW